MSSNRKSINSASFHDSCCNFDIFSITSVSKSSVDTLQNPIIFSTKKVIGMMDKPGKSLLFGRLEII